MEDKPLNLVLEESTSPLRTKSGWVHKTGIFGVFRGRIAAMQLYNVALTAEQINAVKKVGLGNYS